MRSGPTSPRRSTTHKSIACNGGPNLDSSTLDPELTGGIGGTGLGLCICRELVRRIDGRIWVEETSGGGSTFVVEIPREAAKPAGNGQPTTAEILG